MKKHLPMVIVLVSLMALPAWSITRIEGEYQLQLDVRRQDRAYPWDFESNSDDTWAASQLRIFTTPRNGVEAFVKLEADWNSGANNNDRPVYQYRESHLRFWKEFQGAEAEARLFSRQDRFWIENNLLQLVNSDKSVSQLGILARCRLSILRSAASSSIAKIWRYFRSMVRRYLLGGSTTS